MKSSFWSQLETESSEALKKSATKRFIQTHDYVANIYKIALEKIKNESPEVNTKQSHDLAARSSGMEDIKR